MNILQISAFAVVLQLMASIVSAAPLTDALFADQRAIFTSNLDDQSHVLTLSSLKKVNSVWVAEREASFVGDLNRRTIELERQYSKESAWLELQQFFTNQPAQLIFECQGLDCGSSNAWANERFEIKQLYGLDLSQRYQVWQINNQQGAQFVTVYLVQRGNRRVYLHIEVLTPDDAQALLRPSPAVIAKAFYRDGQIELRGLSFEEGNIVIDEEYLAAFAEAFNQQPFRRLTVVGHDFFPGSAEEQNQRSLQHAQAVFDVLVKLGVRARRMEVDGVGGLAPDKNDLSAKVVVLLQGSR